MRMRTFLRKHLDDLLIVAGEISIAIGAFLVNPIVGFFLVGVELIVLGVLVGLGAKNANQ